MSSVTTAASLARIGSLLSDETRAEILCALMDGRAHTGSELARHVGVARSTTSEHLSKLLDAEIVVVEAQGRHRYWRLANAQIAGLLETLGATATPPPERKAPNDLALARTCYDHLAGDLAVRIFDQLVAADRLTEDKDGHLHISQKGYDLFRTIGVDVDSLRLTQRTRARACLDWTERRHHLAGAAGAEVLEALFTNGWLRHGNRPRIVRVTAAGRQQIIDTFGLQPG